MLILLSNAGSPFWGPCVILEDFYATMKSRRGKGSEESMHRILLVEDDRDISIMLKEFLDTEGFEVVTAYDGETACERFFAERFSLILLAKDTDSDKTLGLGLGADDYITKPFSVTEVLARIKANIRRSTEYSMESGKQEMLLKKGKLVMNLNDYSVRKDGKRIELAAKEFDIFEVAVAKSQKGIHEGADLFSCVEGGLFWG